RQPNTVPSMESRPLPNDTNIGDEVVSTVQPYQARKAYVCPGCESSIEPGVGHLVIVPTRAPDLRRHWHRGCWFKEQRRRHGLSNTR
ncbi:MAG: hypothetical protein U9R47_09695, partial [Actinomycetota bacterium]|nr:hypothetical protein [Actinomycetota bacterium]